ncbi:MAG TPA: hypothetical protein VGA37_09770 [Gemmatimonadales bacterium]
MRTGSIVLLVFALCSPAALSAQGVSGTYVMQGDQGPVTITLRQDAGGKVTGTMSGGGVTYTVEGVMEQGTAVGAVYDQSGGMFFEASVDGGRLMLTLFDAGQDGQPVYDSARQLVFESRGTAGTPGTVGKPPTSGQARGAWPLAGGGAGAGKGLMGAWSCQSPEGPAQMIFRSESQLEYNGSPVGYQLVGDMIRVSDGGGTADYGYQLAGDNLTVRRPDGTTTQCRRGGGAQVAAPGTGQGGAPPAGQPGQFDHLLQGMLCSYSSSPDGGYSRSTRVSFDGRGGMSIGNEASWNVETGSGYSGQGGNRARYRVEGTTVGSRVQLQFADGTTGVATVNFVTGGRITELNYEGTLFGATLC